MKSLLRRGGRLAGHLDAVRRHWLAGRAGCDAFHAQGLHPPRAGKDDRSQSLKIMTAQTRSALLIGRDRSCGRASTTLHYG